MTYLTYRSINLIFEFDYFVVNDRLIFVQIAVQVIVPEVPVPVSDVFFKIIQNGVFGIGARLTFVY